MPRPHDQTGGGALITVAIPSALGTFTAHFSERGLARLDFPKGQSRAEQKSSARVPDEWIKFTEKAVTAIVAGKDPRALPPFDLRVGTEFQQRVWAALQRIRAGETKTYGEIAAIIGAPNATRAVGGACGANPIPLLIPCHRVLASGGRLGGFSAGLEWKRQLLDRELPWFTEKRR